MAKGPKLNQVFSQGLGLGVSPGLGTKAQGRTAGTIKGTKTKLREPGNRSTAVQQKQRHISDWFVMPEEEGSLHVVTYKRFDLWQLIRPLANTLRELGAAPLELYTVSWIMNRPSCQEIVDLLDQGIVSGYTCLTHDYFRDRQPQIYNFFAEETRRRRQTFTTAQVHAKLIGLGDPDSELFLVVEGSANLTNNQRIENYTITRSRILFDFHREWIREVLGRA